MAERITVREGGKTRRVTKQRALVKALTAKALQGDVRATSALLALCGKLIPEAADEQNAAPAEDELILLRRFGPGFLKSLTKTGGRT